MSSPAEFFNSLPPISKAYGTACLLATTAIQLGLYDVSHIALIYKYVFKHFQMISLCMNFGMFIAVILQPIAYRARYGVQLDKGPFERRTADFLWMMIFGALSLLVSFVSNPNIRDPFLKDFSCFYLLYVWSREFPNAQINIYGFVTLKAFYLPWAMLALDVIFGSPLIPDLLGIIAGHLYYFLTVLHPLATGKVILKTPMWVYPCIVWLLEVKNTKLVSRWRIGAPSQPTSSGAGARPDRSTGVAFRGRSYRLNG
ncbi:hypothetical protein REPUB_Repub18cG0101900 [Reevesia pubescens]